MSPDLRIGQLAERLQMSVETVRYYEREGLLPAPLRTMGNYRTYPPELIDRLGFIRNCRALDMTLVEIRALLALRDAPDDGCSGVNDLLDAHIDHVKERLAELRNLRGVLEDLRARCTRADTVGTCQILNGLSEGAPSRRSASSPLKVHATRRKVRA